MSRKGIDVNNPDSYVVCPICGSKMRQINWSHAKKHDMTINGIKSKFPDVKIVSNDISKKLSISTSKQMKVKFANPEFMEYWREKKSEDMKRIWKRDYDKMSKISSKNLSEAMIELHKNPEWKAKNIEAHSKGLKKKWSKDKEYADKISNTTSKTMKKRWAENEEWVSMMKEKSRETLRKISNECWKDPSYVEMQREKGREAFNKLWEDPKFREKMIKVNQDNLKNPEIRKRMLSCDCPNKSEKYLRDLLDEMYPNEWMFVGDGKIKIDNKYPDFININGKKLIIELYGDYWHKNDDPLDRIKTFKPYGYNTLVIWESELKNDLDNIKNKIKEFIKCY